MSYCNNMGRGATAIQATVAKSRSRTKPIASADHWPLDWKAMSFSYSGVDYESEESHGPCDCDSICRCRTISYVRITDVDVSATAKTILDQLQVDAHDQKSDMKRFLGRKAGKAYKGKPDEEIFAAYADEFAEKQLQERSRQIPYLRERAHKRGLLTPDQVERQFDDLDQLGVQYILNRVKLDKDDFEAEVVGGYYGEEVNGVYLENKEKTERIEEQLSSFLAARSDKERVQWIYDRQYGADDENEAKISSVSRKSVSLSEIDPSALEDQRYENADAVKQHRERFERQKQWKQTEEHLQAILTPNPEADKKGQPKYLVFAGAEVLAGASEAGKRKLPVVIAK